MFRRYLRKKRKLLSGLYLTHVKGRVVPNDREWWDAEFYPEEITDSATIVSGTHPLATRHHYASIELLLTRHLHRSRHAPASVCDVGSGAGHWVDFYRALGASHVTAVDVSSKAVRHLSHRYADDGAVEVVRGGVENVGSAARFDTVNAIGVMFHLVDDDEWLSAISRIADLMLPGGLLIVGGHFGWNDGVNVQFGADGSVNKRLRSLKRWRQVLQAAGFVSVSVKRNNAYLFIDEPMPESNLLFATRS